MQKHYYVSGRYQARYPDGHHTGLIGISARVQAQDEQEAQQTVSQKAIKTHGYIKFDWLDVKTSKIQ